MSTRIVHTAFAAALLFNGVIILAADQGGTISGLVLDDANSPVVGGLVTYYNVPPLRHGPTGGPALAGSRVRSAVMTAPDGTFIIRGLQPDKYYLCASGVKPTQLATCDWTAPPEEVDVAAMQQVSGI